MKICINAYEMKFVPNVTQGKEYSEVKNNCSGFVLLITQKLVQIKINKQITTPHLISEF